MQPETARIAEGIEHSPALCQLRHCLTIIALIQEKTGFLALREMNEKTNLSLFDDDRLFRNIAMKQLVMRFKPLELADAALGALVDARRLQQLDKQSNDQVAAAAESEARELHDQPAIVLIDNQPRNPIRFA